MSASAPRAWRQGSSRDAHSHHQLPEYPTHLYHAPYKTLILPQVVFAAGTSWEQVSG